MCTGSANGRETQVSPGTVREPLRATPHSSRKIPNCWRLSLPRRDAESPRNRMSTITPTPGKTECDTARTPRAIIALRASVKCGGLQPMPTCKGNARQRPRGLSYPPKLRACRLSESTTSCQGKSEKLCRRIYGSHAKVFLVVSWSRSSLRNLLRLLNTLSIKYCVYKELGIMARYNLA